MDPFAVDEHVVVMGAGGVAGNIAGYLALAGLRITIVDGWRAHVEAIVERGLRLAVSGGTEVRVARPRALHADEATSIDAIDTLVLGVKAYDNEACVDLLAPHLAQDAVVVSAQNGVQEERLVERLGPERVIGAVVLLAGALEGPGRVRLDTPGLGRPPRTPLERGRLMIGELDGRITPRLLALQRLLQRGIGAPVTRNIRGEIWCKLLMNCMSNPINAVLGGKAADARLEPGPRSVSLRVGAEVAELGRALGYEIPPLAGIEAEELIAAGRGVGVEVVARKWAATGVALGDIAGSMPRDMRQGRKTEADAFCGYVVRKAREQGLRVPASESVHRLVQEIEAGRLTPGPANLERLVGLER